MYEQFVNQTFQRSLCFACTLRQRPALCFRVLVLLVEIWQVNVHACFFFPQCLHFELKSPFFLYPGHFELKRSDDIVLRSNGE